MTDTKPKRRANRWIVSADGPHPVDVHVGQRLRWRRTVLGLSQEMLAELMGISFQQLHKYEKGSNRLSASRLRAVGIILDVSPSYFFEGLPTTGDVQATTHEDETRLTARTVDLVQACADIDDVQVLDGFIKFAEAVVAAQEGVGT